jgi:hypothetical protein
MTAKTTSELATRLSIPAGAILAATFLLAVALSTQSF